MRRSVSLLAAVLFGTLLCRIRLEIQRISKNAATPHSRSQFQPARTIVELSAKTNLSQPVNNVRSLFGPTTGSQHRHEQQLNGKCVF
jgi:hypothetical protein